MTKPGRQKLKFTVEPKGSYTNEYPKDNVEYKTINFINTSSSSTYDLGIPSIKYKYNDENKDYASVRDNMMLGCGRKIEFKVDVKNYGTTESPDYTVVLYDENGHKLDEDSEPSVYQNDTSPAFLSVTVPLDNHGTQRLKYAVEPKDNSTDKNTDNNVEYKRIRFDNVGGGTTVDNRAPEFHQRKVTLSTGKILNVKFYIASFRDFCIEPVGEDEGNSANWAANGAFGTNASFFAEQADETYYMSVLHIFRNENMGKLLGNFNTEVLNDPSTALDFIYYDKVRNKYGLKRKTAEWYPNNNHGIPNMEWGIGGFNLLLEQTFSSYKNFKDGLDAYYPNLNYDKAHWTTSRTAIGYRKDGSVILAAIFGSDMSKPMEDGPNMYEVHLLMKYFGCTKALCLDGSNCTKISYKENGKLKAIKNGSRNTWCRIRLLVSSAENCDWTGK